MTFHIDLLRFCFVFLSSFNIALSVAAVDVDKYSVFTYMSRPTTVLLGASK